MSRKTIKMILRYINRVFWEDEKGEREGWMQKDI